MNPLRFILILLVEVYRLALSPAKAFVFGPTARCRYTPSCSEYAIQALRAHGAFRGTLLTGHRICRCHPWGGCGHDPVPLKHATPRPQHPLSPSAIFVR